MLCIIVQWILYMTCNIGGGQLFFLEQIVLF